MSHTLITLVQQYGLIAIFVLMAAESCGLPVPSEVVVPVGGVLVASGHLNFAMVVAASTFGNLAGSLVAYWLAARFGAPVLLGPGRRVGFKRSHLNMAQRWFDRWGLWAVFVSRMLPVIRTYISFPAGLARVNLPWFCVLTVAGAIPWNAALTIVGVVLRDNYDRVGRPIQLLAIVFALAVAAFVVWWFLHGRHDEGDEPTTAAA